jgi:hypothetical protein
MYDDSLKDRKPKHSHYVSNENLHVYPAMTGLPGYEDDNPKEWRPANSAEKQNYLAGDRTSVNSGDIDFNAAPAVVATPRSLKLVDDDEPVAAQAIPVAPPPAPTKAAKAAAAIPPLPPLPPGLSAS